MEAEKMMLLRQLQLKQIDMLKAVRDICEKHGITYYLGCGTLLGAVRHKGFIPWDDDVDVIMPYEDYNKFLEIAPSELDERFFLQTGSSDENFYRAFSTVRYNNTTMMRPHHTKYYTHQGVWLDIFPLVEVGDGLERRFKKMLLTVCNYMRMDNYLHADLPRFEKLFGKFGLKCVLLFYKIPFATRKKMHKRLLHWICKAKNKKYITEVWGNMTDFFPKEIFIGDPVYLEYEGELYRVPPHYKEYLEVAYGDYMQLPPEEKRTSMVGLRIDLENDYTKYLE